MKIVQPPTAIPAEGGKKKGLLGIAVPPNTTATPMEKMNIEKRLKRGAVPPSTTATPKDKKTERLLWVAVPQSTTATPAKNVMKKGIVRRDSEIVPPKHSKLESRQVPPCNTRIKTKIAEVKMPGELTRNEVIVSRSTITKRRGNILQVQKSTKGAKISNTVSEIRQIWENKNLEKSEIGPGSSANKPICVEPMGGQILPTVLDRPTAPKGSD